MPRKRFDPTAAPCEAPASATSAWGENEGGTLDGEPATETGLGLGVAMWAPADDQRVERGANRARLRVHLYHHWGAPGNRLTGFRAYGPSGTREQVRKRGFGVAARPGVSDGVYFVFVHIKSTLICGGSGRVPGVAS
jgi:hypothetical protein